MFVCLVQCYAVSATLCLISYHSLLWPSLQFLQALTFCTVFIHFCSFRIAYIFGRGNTKLHCIFVLEFYHMYTTRIPFQINVVKLVRNVMCFWLLFNELLFRDLTRLNLAFIRSKDYSWLCGPKWNQSYI